MSAWSGRKVTEARAWMATRIAEAGGLPCGKCGLMVEPGTPYVVGHIIARTENPALTWEPTNWTPEHKACSDSSGQTQVIANARRAALADHGIVESSPRFARRRPGFSHRQLAEKSPPLPFYTHGKPDRSEADQIATRENLTWAELVNNAPDWLKGFLELPEDGAPPLWVSGVHSEAVGSYGPAAIEWMESNLTERGRPLRLRWWQRLAIVLQLQHRADGSLCWRVIIESGPRRIGKSVRLRGMALWRLAKGPELFEPEQLVVHTGKDLAIVREVMRKAWPWAFRQIGWDGKRGMTEPEVSYDGVNRWVARSKEATTGYDACLALVDESWDVAAANIDDDLEPSMLERQSPQLVLTSTAHRKATSLMRGRIIDALTVDDGETMLLVWAAPVGADAGDPRVWRAASPHWSEDRAKMMASKYAKALAGESDPEFDDPDPMEGFRAQYLNQWRLRERKSERGNVAVPGWAALADVPPLDVPDAAAIEGWPGGGLSVAYAWRTDDRVTVSALDVPDLASAALAVAESGFRGRVTVGASLADDPALRHLRKTKGMGRTTQAVQTMQRLVSEDAIRHDGSEHLAGQVAALRTLPSADGIRLASQGRAEAVKAATWAAEAARTQRASAPLVLLPTGT